jgi:hypothetical protein
MLEHESKNSRHIERLSYDDGTLKVSFRNGSSKSFSDVPRHVYEQMIGSPSLGKYFHNVIKLHYRCLDDARKDKLDDARKDKP